MVFGKPPEYWFCGAPVVTRQRAPNNDISHKAAEEGAAEGAAGNLIGDADLQAALNAGQVGEHRFFAAGLESAGGAAVEGAALDTVIAEADAAAVSVTAEDAAAEAVLAEAGEPSIIGELLEVVVEVGEV